MEDWLRFSIESIRILPFEFLSGMGVIGVFAGLLLLYREKLPILLENQGKTPIFGLTMGTACVFLTLLMPNQISGELKPVLALLDFIFISGFIGGWRNALITFTFTASSIYISYLGYGIIQPSLAPFPMFWNYISFAFAGIMAHHLFFRRFLTGFNLKNIILLILWRFASTTSLLLLSWWLLEVNMTVVTEVLMRRIISSFTVSAFVLAVIVLLLRQALEQDKRLYADLITKLPNRRALQRYLMDILVTRHKKKPISRTLLLLEMDNVQQLLQSYGHARMDKYARWFARELEKITERWVPLGYEPRIFAFAEHSTAIVLSNITKEQIQSKTMAQQFFNAVNLFGKKPGYELSPTFTLSVIDIVIQKDHDPIHFLRTVTMLEKRRTGRVQFFEGDIVQQMILEENIRILLTQCIEQNNVSLGFQPKVTMADGSCYGAEALLRIQPNDKSKEHTNPQEVLAIAEKYNLRNQLEWTIICSAISAMAELPPSLDHLRISVNITPDMLSIDGFGQKVTNLLRKNNLDPKRFIIEIIETDRFILDLGVRETIKHLTDQGIILSLDDFGTGYSSISLLSQCPFKELKLDYSMISDSTNPRVYAAIQLSIEGAKKYQATVVAEGIETTKQCRQLMDMGITYGQGFLFGKAMPLDNFITYATQTDKK